MALRLTHVGGPTLLAESHGWSVLSDPTFDPPGERYSFGWGAGSTKTVGPAVPADGLPQLDVVLVTHDQHGDNLDTLGRSLLPAAGTVVTTRVGARRLRLPNVRGLAPWESTTVSAPGRPELTITATPCRHGPPLSKPIVGDVVGFALQWAGDAAALWFTGDTVMYDELREAATRLSVDVVVLHLGVVRFPITGPLRYTMGGHDGAELVRLVRPRVAVPVHFEGWSHFSEQEDALRAELAAAPPGVREVVRWLPRGEAVDV